MIVSSEGIIIHSMNYSDTSKIVTMYSKEFGKIKLLAKGARKNSKSFGSSLEVLSHIRVIFYKKDERSLHLISKSEIIRPSTKLCSSFTQLSYALAIAELVKQVFHDEEKNLPIYQLVIDAMDELTKIDRGFENIYFSFLMNLFSLSGFAFDIKSCFSCKKDLSITNDDKFCNITNGVFYCAVCHNKTKYGEVKFREDVFKVLDFIYSGKISNSKKINFNDSIGNEIKNFLHRYGEFHLHGMKSLNSLKLLDSYSQFQGVN